MRVGAAALALIPILAFAEGRQTENQSLPVSSQQQIQGILGSVLLL